MPARPGELAPSLLASIEDVVRRAGGDGDDLEQLVEAWARLCGDERGRLARLRYSAQHPACRCVDRPELHEGRCSRCHGVRREVLA